MLIAAWAMALMYEGGKEAVGVPEPTTWAMMLLGFGRIGVAMRRRRRCGVLMQLA